MKKLILFALLCICATTSNAQESKLTGTWIGTFRFQHLDDSDDWVWCNRKLYIRIYKYDNYGLKMKEVPGDGACNKCTTSYYEECIITHVDDNAIYFYDKQDWGRNEWGGVEICEDHYSLTHSNGTLRLTPVKRIIIEYDRYGSIRKKDDVTHRAAWILKNITLYKEETDW